MSGVKRMKMKCVECGEEISEEEWKRGKRCGCKEGYDLVEEKE